MRKFWCMLMVGIVVFSMQTMVLAGKKQTENSQRSDQIQTMSEVSNKSQVLVQYGSRGEDVKVVQNLLNHLGYPVGTVDGVCGAMTTDSIKFFQRINSLPENGVVNEIMLQALKRAEPISSRGMRSISMHATGYSAYDPGNGQYTSRGTFLRKGLVAVDPRVIPLGTKLYVPGYGNAIADDTGGAIRGNKIDLAFDSHREALQFGRRDIMVYVLD